MNGQTIVKSLLFLFRLMPFPVVDALGDAVGFILYRTMKERTALGLENLSRAFPEKTDEERRAILKTFWQNFCKDMLEMFKYYGNPALIKGKRVTIDGKEHLDELMAQKKGSCS